MVKFFWRIDDIKVDIFSIVEYGVIFGVVVDKCNRIMLLVVGGRGIVLNVGEEG